jgi:hypothetical protein
MTQAAGLAGIQAALATAQRNNFVYTRRADLTGAGALFASTWMLAIGVLNSSSTRSR